MADLVVLLGAAADVEHVAAPAAVDDPAPVVGLDPVVAAPRPDGVRAVTGVDEVASGAAVETVVLAGRLTRRLVVAPEHVAPRAGVDGVAAVAAQQLVMPRSRRHHAALVGLVEPALAVAAPVD